MKTMGRMYVSLCCSTIVAGALALFALLDGNTRLSVDLLGVGVALLVVAVLLGRRCAPLPRHRGRTDRYGTLLER